MKQKTLVEFQDNAIEIDGHDAWKAEAALKLKGISYREKNNIFYFENGKDADTAFRIFNRLKLIIY